MSQEKSLYVEVEWPVMVKITRTRSGNGVSWEYSYEIDDFLDEPDGPTLAEILNEELNRVE